MTDLKTALSDHLSSLPDDAVGRVRRVDYRPRTHRISARATVGAVGGTAAATAVAVSAVLLTTASPAFAGWTATPAASHPIAARASCESRLAALPNSPSGTWKAIVSDQRGPFTLTVYANGATYGTCLVGRALTAVGESTTGSAGGSFSAAGSGSSSGRSTGGSTSVFHGGGTGTIRQLTVTHLSATGQGAYTVADGQVASDVSALTFVLSDGQHVETTLADGWFVAWWPGPVDAVSALVTTPAGTKTEPVQSATPPAGTSGTSGSGTSGASMQLSGSSPAGH